MPTLLARTNASILLLHLTACEESGSDPAQPRSPSPPASTTTAAVTDTAIQRSGSLVA
jgi:hypothetical protein